MGRIAYDHTRSDRRSSGPDHGIQRVDACRAPGGGLLPVELEDLNPYLSLDALDEARRDSFVTALRAALRRFLAA